MDGMNLTKLLVMWTLGLKALVGCKVNLPHLRKPENTEVVATSKLRWQAKGKCVSVSRSLLSTGDGHFLTAFSFTHVLFNSSYDALEQQGIAWEEWEVSIDVG